MRLRSFLIALLASLTGAFAVATVAAAVVRFFAADVAGPLWAAAWFGGAVAVGLVAAITLATRSSATAFDAASEIDGRLALRERVASALTLDDASRRTDAGQALVDDAARRVESLDLVTPFPLAIGRRWLLPVLPAVLLVLVVALPGLEAPSDQALVDEEAEKAQWERTRKPLQRELNAARREAEKTNLKDAAQLIATLESKLAATPQPPRTEQALVKLNNLADELRNRRDRLADPDQLRRQMGSLSPGEGRTSELTKAMRAGDLERAQRELERMKSQLDDAGLSAEERERLTQQMEALERSLERFAARQGIASQGNIAPPSESDGDASQQNDGNPAELPDGDLKDAPPGTQVASQIKGIKASMGLGERIDALGEILDELDMEFAERELLERTLDRIGDARRVLACSECDGEGCSQCQGDGDRAAVVATGSIGSKSGSSSGRPGPGPSGAAEGAYGERPEAKTDTQTVDARFDPNIRKGQSVVVGEADGPNARGVAGQKIRTAGEAQDRRDADPLAEQRLPRRERDRLREYFDRLRGEKK